MSRSNCVIYNMLIRRLPLTHYGNSDAILMQFSIQRLFNFKWANKYDSKGNNFRQGTQHYCYINICQGQNLETIDVSKWVMSDLSVSMLQPMVKVGLKRWMNSPPIPLYFLTPYLFSPCRKAVPFHSLTKRRASPLAASGITLIFWVGKQSYLAF